MLLEQSFINCLKAAGGGISDEVLTTPLIGEQDRWYGECPEVNPTPE